MTNNKQQTAVDSIIELCQELLANHYSISHDGVCSEIIRFCQEQAKEMEKEEHEATALAMIEYALDNIEGKNNLNGKDAFDQYYNETYGGGEQ